MSEQELQAGAVPPEADIEDEALDEGTDGSKTAEERIAFLERQLAKARKQAGERRVRLKEQGEQLKEREAKLSTLEEQAAALTGLRTEFESVKVALDAAEKARQAAEAQALRVGAAAKAGLPPELATRLQGSTAEEIEKDAAALAALIPRRGGASSPANATGGTGTGGRAQEFLDRALNRGAGGAFDPVIAATRGGGVVLD